MIKLMPALEAYAIANVATQNLMGGNPFQVILGDLNASSGSGTGLASLMGPQPNVLTVKEMLTGTMNETQYQLTGSTAAPSASLPSGYGTGQATAIVGTSATSPLDALSQNFQNNFGNIVVGSIMTTAGFRIANKVLSKPKNKFNKMLRDVGLGSTVQI
jgi:hypothetical protein